MYRATLMSQLHEYNSPVKTCYYSRSPRQKQPTELLLEQVKKRARRNHIIFAATWIMCITVNVMVLFIKIL